MPQRIESTLQQELVQALADEALSIVHVETEGRDVLLTGPENAVRQATALAYASGARVVTKRILASSIERMPVAKQQPDQREQRLVVDAPTHHSLTRAALKVDKRPDLLTVRGTVPSGKIRQEITKKLADLSNAEDQQINVTIDRLSEKPVWYLQDLPLMIPFLAWVDEGHLAYEGEHIWINGRFTGAHAERAFNAAIAELPARFVLHRHVRVGK